MFSRAWVGGYFFGKNSQKNYYYLAGKTKIIWIVDLLRGICIREKTVRNTIKVRRLLFQYICSWKLVGSLNPPPQLKKK
jgi:hypothetical protein